MRKITIKEVIRKMKSEDPGSIADIDFFKDMILGRVQISDIENHDHYRDAIGDFLDRSFQIDWPDKIAKVLQLNEDDSPYHLIIKFYCAWPNFAQGMSQDGQYLIISPLTPLNPGNMPIFISPSFLIQKLRLLSKEYF